MSAEQELREMARVHPEEYLTVAKRYGGAIENRMMSLYEEAKEETDNPQTLEEVYELHPVGFREVLDDAEDLGFDVVSEPLRNVMDEMDTKAEDERGIGDKKEIIKKLAETDVDLGVVKSARKIAEQRGIDYSEPENDRGLGELLDEYNDNGEEVAEIEQRKVQEKEESPGRYPIYEPAEWEGKWVYVAEGAPGRVKVGMSKDPETRLKNLQRGHPYELELLLAVGVRKTRTVENWIHEQFSDHNTHGEWFKFPPEDVNQFVESIRGLASITEFSGGLIAEEG